MKLPAARSAAPVAYDNHAVRFGVLTQGLPDILGGDTPSEGSASLGCMRQIILKILGHLIFKMTAVPTSEAAGKMSNAGLA